MGSSSFAPDKVIGFALTCFTQYLFYIQPGVDRAAVLKWGFDMYPGEPLVGCVVNTFIILIVLPAIIIGSYFTLYHFEWPIFERYRVENWYRVGWNDPDPEKRKEYLDLNWRALRAFVPKQFTLFFLCTIAWGVSRYLNLWPPERVTLILSTIPDTWTTIWQLAVGLAVFETIFYWGHRVQHWYFYSSHKVHHEFVNPNVLTAPHGDDADGWLTLFLPGLLPAIVLQFHMYTFAMWALIHYTHTYLDHSGYEFPYSPLQLIPLSGYVRAHDFHHTANVCNYGLYWRFWDWLMATDKEWIAHEAKAELRFSLSQSTPNKIDFTAPKQTAAKAD